MKINDIDKIIERLECIKFSRSISRKFRELAEKLRVAAKKDELLISFKIFKKGTGYEDVGFPADFTTDRETLFAEVGARILEEEAEKHEKELTQRLREMKKAIEEVEA